MKRPNIKFMSSIWMLIMLAILMFLSMLLLGSTLYCIINDEDIWFVPLLGFVMFFALILAANYYTNIIFIYDDRLVYISLFLKRKTCYFVDILKVYQVISHREPSQYYITTEVERKKILRKRKYAAEYSSSFNF